MSKVEVLVATMNQIDFSLIEKMNIQTDAIICNQFDKYEYQELVVNDNKIRIFSTNDKGVGKNRNIGLLNAQDEYLIIADDDLVYLDGYEKIIIEAFKKNKKADILVFNLSKKSKRKMNKNNHKVNYFNFMRYGAVRIAIRKKSLDKANIWFSTLYGGGATFSCGEDTLFLAECLKKKLKIIAIPDIIAELTFERGSTWNTGNAEKLLKDKGFLLANAFPKTKGILKYIFAWKFRKENTIGFFKAYKLINKGIKEFRK